MFGEDAQLHIKGINIDWDKISRGSYLRDIPSIAGVSSLMFHKPITFFVGENGSGKSTLCNCINGLIPFSYEGEITGSCTVNGIETSTASIFKLSDSVG